MVVDPQLEKMAESKNSDSTLQKDKKKVKISNDYFYYEKCIKFGFNHVSICMFLIIAVLIYYHTKNLNYFNKYFYDSCNAPGVMSVAELFEVDREISAAKEEIKHFHTMASRDSSYRERNAEKLNSFKNTLNTSLETCNAQLHLRKPCYIKQLQDFDKTNKQIYDLFVVTHIAYAIVASVAFFFCYKKLENLSTKNSYILDTLHLKKIIKFFICCMTLFCCLLYIQYGDFNYSVNVVPVPCGNDDAAKSLTEECYYNSSNCYSFPKMFEYFPPLPCMFVLCGTIAISCFLAAVANSQ